MMAHCFGWLTGLVTIQNRLRCGFAHFKLCAHFLDLRGLLFHCRSQDCNFLLQLGNRGSLLLHCLVLFEELVVLLEKLVEQHGVHCLVAHRIGFALLVTSHEARIHLFHVLGHEAELRSASRVKLMLVAESHGLQGEDCFARLVHRLDRFLKARRGCSRAETTVGVYDNCYTCWNGCPTDSRDKCGRLTLCPANTNGARFISLAQIADVDIVVARGKIAARSKSQRDVVVASCVAKERTKTRGCVPAAGCVVLERKSTVASVVAAGRIGIERSITRGRVVAAGCVDLERIGTGGRVLAAS